MNQQILKRLAPAGKSRNTVLAVRYARFHSIYYHSGSTIRCCTVPCTTIKSNHVKLCYATAGYHADADARPCCTLLYHTPYHNHTILVCHAKLGTIFYRKDPIKSISENVLRFSEVSASVHFPYKRTI